MLWGLMYKTLRIFHPNSVRTHKREILHMHKSFQIYKSMHTPEHVQKSLYKSQSGEDDGMFNIVNGASH